jgi:hypothetical protein
MTPEHDPEADTGFPAQTTNERAMTIHSKSHLIPRLIAMGHRALTP